MRKILTIAIREYFAMVGTKAFVISIVMMPILMLGGLIAMELLQNVGQVRDRKIAVIDHTGQFFSALDSAAVARNQVVDLAVESGDQGEVASEIPGASLERYLLSKVETDDASDDLRFKLSEQIRDQALYAFVEIPADILSTSGPSEVEFYSEDSSISIARRWIGEVISEVARQKRIAESGLQPGEIEKFAALNAKVPTVGRGLMDRAADGSIVSSQEKDVMLTLFLPMGIMMFMFMVIFMASQPMLESVLEEKSQRIAEVLLGSANPSQLMMGKLLGTVAGSLTTFAIYIGGIVAVASYRDWTQFIPFELIPWFLIFQIVGVLFYASIFMAVGASVSQLKEAQSMLLPVWMMLMAPLFVWFMIVQDPQGPMAVTMSFIPPTAPTTMVLRLATGQTIPVWQPVVALIVTLIATLVIVVLAGRIFRVGILWQGKTPRFSEIVKWAFVGE